MFSVCDFFPTQNKQENIIQIHNIVLYTVYIYLTLSTLVELMGIYGIKNSLFSVNRKY